jgi:hypothetical protein
MSFADLVAAADRAAQAHLGGIDVVYQPAAGDPVTVKGIFDDAYVLTDHGETGTELLGPAVFLRLEDLPIHPEQDDPILTIEGRDYRVRARQDDGLGGIRLLLVAG